LAVTGNCQVTHGEGEIGMGWPQDLPLPGGGALQPLRRRQVVPQLAVQHAEPVEGDGEFESLIAGVTLQQCDPLDIQRLGLTPASLTEDEGCERDEVPGDELRVRTRAAEPDGQATPRQHLTLGVCSHRMVNAAEVVIDGGEVLPVQAFLPLQQTPGPGVMHQSLPVPTHPLAPEPELVQCSREVLGKHRLRGCDGAREEYAVSRSVQGATLAFGSSGRVGPYQGDRPFDPQGDRPLLEQQPR
jgi:hypothetical protein